MIICEKQIMQLMQIADAYCGALLTLGEHLAAEEVQAILNTINDQQSEELKVIE